MIVFHARTAAEADGDQISDGLRVFRVTATGRTIVEDLRKAYDGVEKTDWEAGFWRTDIAWRAVEREKEASQPAVGSATQGMLS